MQHCFRITRLRPADGAVYVYESAAGAHGPDVLAAAGGVRTFVFAPFATEPDFPGYEPLEELLAKEPLIRDAYRMFVTTGELRTSMVVDDSASYKHIMMILESFFESPENMVMWCDDWAAANGEVTSHCPTLPVPAPPEPEPYVQQPTPPELVDFERRLRYEVVNSRIPCMYKRACIDLMGASGSIPLQTNRLDHLIKVYRALIVMIMQEQWLLGYSGTCGVNRQASCV